MNLITVGIIARELDMILRGVPLPRGKNCHYARIEMHRADDSDMQWLSISGESFGGATRRSITLADLSLPLSDFSARILRPMLKQLPFNRRVEKIRRMHIKSKLKGPYRVVA